MSIAASCAVMVLTTSDNVPKILFGVSVCRSVFTYLLAPAIQMANRSLNGSLERTPIEAFCSPILLWLWLVVSHTVMHKLECRILYRVPFGSSYSDSLKCSRWRGLHKLSSDRGVDDITYSLHPCAAMETSRLRTIWAQNSLCMWCGVRIGLIAW